VNLSGRVALVTGGGRGIGRGISLALGRAGADVAINYRRDEVAALEVAKELEAMGRKAVAVQADVSDYEQVKGMVAKAVDHFKKVDILVNNAGISGRGNLIRDTEPYDFERTLRVHLFGSFYCTREVLPIMKENKRGDIQFISSIAARDRQPYVGSYAAAKSGIEALASVLAKEELKANIRVNVISCGPVETLLAAKSLKVRTGKDIWELAREMPFGRLCQPEDVGNLCAFLCSEQGAYISGDTIYVDGGYKPQLNL